MAKALDGRHAVSLENVVLKVTAKKGGEAQYVVDVRRWIDATTIKARSGYRS